jgi:hypothetical protein
VGEAWLAEDLSAIVKHFGSRRASVDLGSLGRSGEYGSAQVYFLFKRLFDRTETREVRLDKLRPAGDSPHATFDWQYVDERKGSSHRVRLFVSMRREAGAWVVDEIKVVPR